MEIQEKVLLDKLLTEKFKIFDRLTFDQVQDEWSKIDPSPNCPYAAVIINKVGKICSERIDKRADLAIEVTKELLEELKVKFRNSLSAEITSIIFEHFPDDLYLQKILISKEVFQRRGNQSVYFERLVESEIVTGTCHINNKNREVKIKVRNQIQKIFLSKKAYERSQLESSKIYNFIKIIFLFRGKAHHKFTGLLLIAGITLLSSPLYERIVVDFLNKKFGLNITSEVEPYYGLILICSGLIFWLIANRSKEG